MKADARKEEYELVELLGRPVLLTDSRISQFTVPQGWFCYRNISPRRYRWEV